MVALSLKGKHHLGSIFVSNYKPVTNTDAGTGLCSGIGLLHKSPCKGMLHLVQNSEMQAGCAFSRVLTGCILLARRSGF